MHVVTCGGINMIGRQIFRRQLSVIVVFSLLLFILLCRVAYVQFIAAESYAKHDVNLVQRSVGQRQQQIQLDSGRGKITDRNGIALTGQSTYALALFPLAKQSEELNENIREVANTLHVSFEEIMQAIDVLEQPMMYQTAQGIFQITEEQAQWINRLNAPGVLGLAYEQRYTEENMIAQHLVGRIGENSEWVKRRYARDVDSGRLHEQSKVGISGLERTFQRYLGENEPTIFSYYVDGKGNQLAGLGTKYSSSKNTLYPLILQTSLANNVQHQLQIILDEQGVQEGAAVILDIQNSEVLAMASRPNIDLSNQTSSWENKALKRYPPGSVFKIVIAAAAMEHNHLSLQDHYFCDGTVEGSDLACWKEGGHGHLTFEDAFAESCNVVFAKLAHQLGPDVMTDYAQKLGLLQPNGWHAADFDQFGQFQQFDREEIGQIFDAKRSLAERKDKGYLYQTGIGQLDVQVTPLALANMMATITKGGSKSQVKAVTDIFFQSGANFHHFEDQPLHGPKIKAYTAYQLRKLLSSVVEKGTAQHVHNEGWQAAGKTGTAESIKVIGEEKMVKNQQWFVGYYPRENPRYAIAVLALNEEVNTPNRSVKVFAKVIAWLDQQSI